MATKKIVIWECDLCGSTALPSAAFNTSNPLPDNWVELIMRSDLGYHFELVICAVCSSAVLTVVKERNKD